MPNERTPRASGATVASPVAMVAIAAALLGGPTPAREPEDEPVQILLESPPARFGAPLPRVQDFPAGVARLFGWTDDGRFVPRAHARDKLCAGDPDMWRRAEAALGASVQAGASREDVAETYGFLLQHCPGDRCWAVQWAERMTGTAGLPAWMLAARCDSQAARRLFARTDVPARALLARAHAARYEGVRDRPPRARVGAAALEVIRASPDGDRAAAFDAAETGDTATVAALVEMARTTKDDAWRRDLRQALASSDHPVARAHLEPCRRSREAALECGLSWSDGTRPPPRYSPTDLDARVRHENIDDLIEKTSARARPALLAALDGCAREDDRGEFYAGWHRVLCLRGLARLDRKRAVAAAPTLALLTAPDAKEVVAAIARHPSPGALASRLRALGLLPARAKTEGLTARDLLTSAGVAVEFDVETSQFPNEHDTLLRLLWALTGDACAGALFGEEPPAERDTGTYRLRAWLDGRGFETSAENLGDWYDVGAALRLLNAIERRRRTGMQFVVLATRDQSAVVAYGPEGGLRTAIAEGLLVKGDGGSSVTSGKAAEEVVRERLEEGER